MLQVSLIFATDIVAIFKTVQLLGLSLESTTMEMLGRAERIAVSKERTTMISTGKHMEEVAERIKVVPFVADGPGFLKLAINSQRGQLSESLTCKQFEGDGYVEVDVNLDDFKETSVFTRLAKAAIGAVLPQLASITLDLAFMLHADDEAELPERLLGVVRLHRLKLR